MGPGSRLRNEATKLSEEMHRSKSTKLSGAQMPEQRRAGQLVCNIEGRSKDKQKFSSDACNRRVVGRSSEVGRR